MGIVIFFTNPRFCTPTLSIVKHPSSHKGTAGKALPTRGKHRICASGKMEFLPTVGENRQPTPNAHNRQTLACETTRICHISAGSLLLSAGNARNLPGNETCRLIHVRRARRVLRGATRFRSAVPKTSPPDSLSDGVIRRIGNELSFRSKSPAHRTP